jgi:hypothetical protein
VSTQKDSSVRVLTECLEFAAEAVEYETRTFGFSGTSYNGNPITPYEGEPGDAFSEKEMLWYKLANGKLNSTEQLYGSD